jgi:hypothetical protein
MVKIYRYTTEDMERAVNLVNEGYAVARAAEIAGVPRITLHDRYGTGTIRCRYLGENHTYPPPPLLKMVRYRIPS